MKFCRTCKKEKPLEEFHKKYKDKEIRRHQCNDCQKVAHKKYADSNRDNIRNKDLIRRYGISLVIQRKIIDDQKGCCFICGRKLKLKGKRANLSPQVDHCHLTGKVRGVLCRPCNMNVVPHFEKHPERMDNLKEYLTRNIDYRELME